MKSDHRSKFFNLGSWKEEACKISWLQRVSNPWPPRYQVRCSTNWDVKPHVRSKLYLPVQWNDMKYIWNSHMYCGCRWKWRVIIAVHSVLLSVVKQTVTLLLSFTLSPTFAHKLYDHWNDCWSVQSVTLVEVRFTSIYMIMILKLNMHEFKRNGLSNDPSFFLWLHSVQILLLKPKKYFF